MNLTLEDAKSILLQKNINIQQSKLQEKIESINLKQSYNELLTNLIFGRTNAWGSIRYIIILNFSLTFFYGTIKIIV